MSNPRRMHGAGTWSCLSPVLLAVAIGAGAASNCTAPVPPGPIALQLVDPATLSPAELKYGRGPTPDPRVVYQPEVVLVEGGPQVVRSVGAEGMQCTIDAGASRAAHLSVGRIAFITERCVGRVLHVNREGDDLTLVLGPVALTDIFEKLEVTFKQAVDLERAIVRPAPQFPGTSYPLEGESAAPPEGSVEVPTFARAADSHWTPDGAGPRPELRRVSQTGPLTPGIPQTPTVRFHTAPLSNRDGIGAELSHAANGIKLVAQAQLRVQAPELDLNLSINGGRVNAHLYLRNAAGLRLAFDAAGGPDFSGNVQLAEPAGELYIPLAGGAPLAVSVKQYVWVRTAFSSKSSFFSAGGLYAINADVGLRYSGGRFEVVGPKGLEVRQSLMSNLGGVSFGPAGLVIDHQLVITAGLSAGLVTVGPSVNLHTSVGASLGSSVGVVPCRGAALKMQVKGGIGWSIWRPIVELVNFFLRLLHVPQVRDHYDIIKTDWLELIRSEAMSGGKICGGAGA